MMKKIWILIVMAAAMVLPAMAQPFDQSEQPQATFRSTSTMIGSGSSYAAQPALNADGTAAYGASESSTPAAPGPRKIVPVTPEGDPTPVGDALLPLLLMAMAYAVITLRRKNADL